MSLYTVDDKYESNWETRVFWKYAASKGVSGTPTAFINGVMLDNLPSTVDEWLGVLNDVKDSQYRPKHKYL